MILHTLKLHNYRMFEDLELKFDQKYSVIIGVNGAGKTTILEAATIALGTLFQQLSDVNKYGFNQLNTSSRMPEYENSASESAAPTTILF